MKKSLSFLLILSVCLTSLCLFSGCGEDAPQVGDTISEPEILASLDDYTDLTITIDLDNKEFSQKITRNIAMRKSENTTTFFEESFLNDKGTEVRIPGSMCRIENGKTTVYRNNSDEWVETDPDTNETLVAKPDYLFGYYGFDYKKITKDGVKFTKQEDSVVNSKDCYVYKTELEYDTNDYKPGLIYVDKQTGIWLKATILDGDKELVTTTITDFKESSLIIPGLKPMAMDEQTILDKDGIIIKAKSIDYSDINLAAKLVLDVTNNTKNNIEVSSHNFIINGLALGQNVVYGECAAGKTSEIEIKIANKYTQESSIELIKDISIRLCIEDADDNPIVKDTGDLVIKTKCDENYVQPVNKEGTLLFDEKGVKFIFQGIEFDHLSNALLKGYCENNYDEPIRVQLTINKTNGKEFDDYGKAHMPMKSSGYTGFTIYQSDLNGITEITSMEVVYSVYYGPQFNSTTLIEKSEPITIEVK